MTLIAINAKSSGPVAVRQGDLIIPGTEVPYGGFSTLVGYKSTDVESDENDGGRDVYLLGVTNAGLQLARVGINDLNHFAKYTFWNPQSQDFSTAPPKLTLNKPNKIYMPGSFSSGSIFFSPYFETFIMVYFNKMVDSTFYIRYLQLAKPLRPDNTWAAGGRNGKGISAEDVEALVNYQWSSEQKLYASSPGKGGFNYAGNAHPEYFNRQYFARSLYPKGTKPPQQRNDWYGSSLIAEKDGGGDGKNLLLSWTSQVTGGADNKGIYQVQLAVLEFDDIPHDADASSSATSTTSAATASATPTKTKIHGPPHIPLSSIYAVVEKGAAVPMKSASRVLSRWLPFIFVLVLV